MIRLSLLAFALFNITFYSIISNSQGTTKASNLTPLELYQDVQKVFDKRCVQCHSCYNAPCQLKLSSPEGLLRGLITPVEDVTGYFRQIDHSLANKRVVYNSKRPYPIAPTRLFVDAKNEDEWRDLDFVSIINQSSEEERLRKLSLVSPPYTVKNESYLSYILKDRRIGFKFNSLNSEVNDESSKSNFKNYQAEFSRQCPTTRNDLINHLRERKEEGSPSGMPYGLPPLDDKELNVVTKWEKAGAPVPLDEIKKLRAISKGDSSLIEKWQDFLNSFHKVNMKENPEDYFKKELVSRYIYEHTFLGHIYFDKANSSNSFFELVRSKNECSKDREVLKSRRAWGGRTANEKIYYCFDKVRSTLVHKTHMPYLMDQAKLDRVQELFFGQKYGNWSMNERTWKLIRQSMIVQKSQRYDETDHYASNPLVVFRDIPVKARYQFLLDDAQFHVTTFIRGPVCKGNTAVNSIDEQFYTLFVKPDSDYLVQLSKRNPDRYRGVTGLLHMPAEKTPQTENRTGIIRDLTQFFFDTKDLVKLAINRRKNWQEYRKSKANDWKKWNRNFSVDDIWTGKSEDDFNPPNLSSALTIFRNYDSASVVQGFVGSTSKTMFVLDYSLFERLVYGLVAGYDVFGSASHQLTTRFYMNYMRMEAEEMFLRFMPSKVREDMRNQWYIKTDGVITEKLFSWYTTEDKIRNMFPLEGNDLKSTVSYNVENYDVFTASLKANNDSDSDKVANYKKEVEYFRDLKSQFVKQVKAKLPQNGYNDTINTDKDLSYTTEDVSINSIQTFDELEVQMSKLAAVNFDKTDENKTARAPWVEFMPNTSYLLVRKKAANGKEEINYYTIVRQKEHFNVAWIASEEARRNKHADSVFFYKGILGSYPNMIFDIDINEAQSFLNTMKSMKAPDQTKKVSQSAYYKDYNQFVEKFGRSRTSDAFWNSYDKLIDVFKEKEPIYAAVLDLNRYGISHTFLNDDLEDEDFRSELSNWYELIAGDNGVKEK